jgi:tripartite-type tricarboxylate transporter receptor subunit TctC
VKKLVSIVAAVTLSTASLHAVAAYPEKQIRLVVPFATGGSASTSARLLADKLTGVLGQTVYVDNLGGANGGIGAAAVKQSAADGYTLLYSAAGLMTVNPSLYKKSAYQVKDFKPVSLTSTFASVLFVNASFPAKTLPELISYAKAHPGEVTFGSAGSGSSGHLWGEVLKARAGIDIRHVPYKGTGPAMNDVIGGHLTFVVDAATLGMQLVQAGKLRALAATSTKRIEAALGVPTFAEQGMAGFETLSWYGVFTPAGTPEAIIDTLSKAIARVAAMPEYQNALKALGMSAASTLPDSLSKQVQDEAAHWAKVIDDARISLD